MFAIFRADLARAAAPGAFTHQAAPWSTRKALAVLVDHQEVWAIAEFRMRQALRRVRGPLRVPLRVFTWVTRQAMFAVTGIQIPTTATIGPGFTIMHSGSVVVHGDAVIGENVTIGHQTTIGTNAGGVPTLGDCIFVGPGARILGAVHVGDGALVGANAVVMHDVPARHVATGSDGTVRPDRHPIWITTEPDR